MDEKSEDEQMLKAISFTHNDPEISGKTVTKKIIDKSLIELEQKIEHSVINKRQFPNDFKFISSHIKSFKDNFETMIQYLEKNNISINGFDFIKEIEQNTSKNYIKSGLHFEHQKIQTIENHNLYSKNILRLVEKIEKKDSIKFKRIKEKIQEYNIESIGIDFSVTENYALNSIQKLLTKTNYKGNVASEKDKIILEFTPAEYLEAYNVIKFKTKRGKNEFSQAERRQALNTLFKLEEKRYLIYYSKRFKNEQNKWVNNVLVEVTNLFNIIKGYEELTDKEFEKLKDGKINKNIENKLIKIRIEPHYILTDQIDSYFMMKNDYLKELKDKYGKVSPFTQKFFDVLHLSVAENITTKNKRKNYDWLFERGWEELATNIKLKKSSYWKAKQYTRCRNIIIKSYNIIKTEINCNYFY